MNFMDLARERFSVRKYSDRVIEREKLDRILEAGRMAPTAKNQQPYKIYVIQSEEARIALTEQRQFCFLPIIRNRTGKIRVECCSRYPGLGSCPRPRPS